MIKLTRPECPYPKALEDKNYKHARNKEALLAGTHSKCMYCESKILAIDFGDVEHIKPKAEEKFPELEFAWENLGIACSRCNNKKSDNYDIGTPYINPYEENPADFLVAEYNWIFARRQNERGHLTIEDIGLNRPELLEQRKTLLDRIMQVIRAADSTSNDQLRIAALASLAEEAAASKEYSMVVAARLAAHGAT
ncbi:MULTISPECIES: HNH endonuclease [unclassified Burkholderia]|uniref:HNH endonuclease n=1 Tax=unclassified Burkholderia TaxID=2613784 RepID=UPI0009E7396A|nr:MULTISPECIES: HNH endonuclease signature motif containing protein [unclassified Burkholderia]